MYALASAGNAASGRVVEEAVLHENVHVGAVHGILVRPGTLASLEAHGVVVDGDAAAFHENGGAYVEVDSVGARGLDGSDGREYPQVDELDAVGLIGVAGPERRILKGRVSHYDIFAVGDVHETRTLLVLVGAFGIPLAAQAESPPVGAAVAVDGAGAAQGESVETVDIDQRGEVFAYLALDAGVDYREIIDRVAAEQDRTSRKVQVGALPEEESAALVYSFRDHYDSASVGRGLVDDALDEFGLDQVRVADRAVVGNLVDLSELFGSGNGGIKEPL